MNEFYRCLLGSNPFANSTARGAADDIVHVQAVHERQLADVVACAEQVRKNCGHETLVLRGEAGSGKTHLLTQFCRWVDQENRVYCRIFRSLPADPATLPWHIVRSLLEQLSRSQHGAAAQSTTLGRLVRRAVEKATAQLPAQTHPLSAEQVQLAVRSLVQPRLRDQANSPAVLDVCDVLLHYFFAREHNAAGRALKWLAGTGSEQLAPATSPEYVLIAFAELAAIGGRGVVLGFDQLDSQSTAQRQALVEFLQTRVQDARNLLLILSCRPESLSEQEKCSSRSPAIWGPLVPGRSVALPGLTRAEAQQIVEARLRRFVEPFLTLAPIRERVEREPMFPLGPDWYQDRARGVAEFHPRDVVLWAAERWQQVQAEIHELGGPAWFDRAGSVPATASTSLAVAVSSPRAAGAQPRALITSDSVPATVPRPSGRVTPSRALLPDAAPAEPPRPKPAHRFVELGAWSVTSINLLALVASVLWWPGMRWDNSRVLAQRTTELPGHGASSQLAFPADVQESSSHEESEAETTSSPNASNAEHTAPSARAALHETRTTTAEDGVGRPSGSVGASVRPSREHDAMAAAVAAPRPANPSAPLAASGSADAAQRSTTAIQPPASVMVPKPANSLAAAQPITGSAAVPPSAGVPAKPARSGASAGTAKPVSSHAGRVVPPGHPAAVHARGTPDGRNIRPSVRPITIMDDPEIDRLVVEAWGLLDRGDCESGRLRLNEALKINRDDPRAEFSLGLIDAMINQDWHSAEEHFAACVRCDPENVPALNNLAVAQVFNRDVDGALKRWKTILNQDAATMEVVQNLGGVRHLLGQDVIRKKNSVVKLLDTLYADAAVATSASFDTKTGFHLMALTLPDGRLLGWADARKMQGPSLLSDSERRTRSAAERPRPVRPHPPVLGGTNPVPVRDGSVHPGNRNDRPPFGPARPGRVGGATPDPDDAELPQRGPKSPND